MELSGTFSVVLNASFIERSVLKIFEYFESFEYNNFILIFAPFF